MPSCTNKVEQKIQCERLTSSPEYVFTNLVINNDIDGIKKYISEDPKNLAYAIRTLSYRAAKHPEIMQAIIDRARVTGFNAGEHFAVIYCLCHAHLKEEIITLLSLPTFTKILEMSYEICI